MSSHPPLPRSALHPPPKSTAQPVLVAASLVLPLTWIGAWIFGWQQAVVLVLTLAIVAIALLAALVRRSAGDHGASAMRRDGKAGADAETPAALAAVDGKHWSLDVFAHIDAQRFAAVCETWFAWAGFDTRHECHRTQEGVDIWLHAPRIPGPVAIVRCKHTLDKPVGLQELREFQGVVSACKDTHGTFTTTSTYTPEALEFARENGIELVDGQALLRRILTRTRHSQQALLAVAYHGR